MQYRSIPRISVGNCSTSLARKLSKPWSTEGEIGEVEGVEAIRVKGIEGDVVHPRGPEYPWHEAIRMAVPNIVEANVEGVAWPVKDRGVTTRYMMLIKDEH